MSFYEERIKPLDNKLPSIYNVHELEATIAKAKAGVEMMELKQTMHGVFKAKGNQKQTPATQII
jgi:hypothetical protein